MNVDKKTLMRLGGAILLLYLIIHYWDAFTVLLFSLIAAATPLLIGCLIAYLVNILMSLYERFYYKGRRYPHLAASRRPVCMLLAFGSLIFIIVVVFLLIVPELISCLQLLAQEIPKVWNRSLLWIENNMDAARWAQIESFVGKANFNWSEIMKRALEFFTSGVGGVMGGVTTVITRTFSTLVTLLVAVIFSIYLLASKERLHQQLRRVFGHYLKPLSFRKACYVSDVLHKTFHRFIVGQCAEAVILGSLCAAGMYLFRFPYANMVGALVGFTALIPVAGAYIGAGVGAFMIFTVSPLQALFFLIFLTVLQQLEGNIIYPRVVGASIGLPGMWVLAAITMGGALMGIAGMLLGVPLAATLYQLLRDDMSTQPLRKKD